MKDREFLALTDLLPEPLLLLTGEGRILAANLAARHRLGPSLSDSKGQHLTDVVADPKDKVATFLHRCRRNRQLVLGSLEIRDADGETQACRAEGGLLRPRSSETDALLLLRLQPQESTVGRFIDLNQRIDELDAEVRRRRVAEDAMRRQKELWQVTLHSIGDAVITTDEKGNVTSLNDTAEALTGWPLDEAAGRPLATVFRLVDEEDRQPVEDPTARVLREGVTVGLANHTVLIARDGREHPIADSAAPIIIKGKIIGCVLVFRDVTERRRAEEALREADRRKDEFLATLSHELRNPLAPIATSVAILERSEPDPETIANSVSTIRRQLRHIARLVDDLLDVRRITHDRLELRRQRVELSSIIDQAIEMCRSADEHEGCEIAVDLPPEPVHLSVDPVRLTQAINNLLDNAVRYSEPGDPIVVTARVDGADLIISVIDSGIGIDRDQLTAIFEMFSQVNEPRQRTSGGLGIGLTLARRLVELHGGTLTAHSEGRGRGTEFRIRLPGIAPAPEADAEPAEEPSRGAVAATGKRVLVVDDNHDNATSLAAMLRLSGYETDVAHDGPSAVAMAAGFRPDVMLLDIGMPQMSGLEVCRRIRDTEGGTDIVMVALTGWGRTEDRQASLEAGFDDHFVKPVDPQELLQYLSKLDT